MRRKGKAGKPLLLPLCIWMDRRIAGQNLRMLITDEGQLTGAISGGCLEGDALRKALLCVAAKIHACYLRYNG